MAQKTIEEKVLAATGSAKSKTTLAEKFDVSYTYVSRTVNALVKKGKLIAITGKQKKGAIGRPATLYKRAA